MKYEDYLEAAHHIDRMVNASSHIGIILGTGLGGLIDDLEIEHEIPYEVIPHFPLSTVESHSGKFIFGSLSGVPVWVMQGRFHAYEGYSAEQITFPIRVMKLLGVENLLISNAAGGIRQGMKLGELMVIEDHINLQFQNPLTGENADDFGPRFPDMFEAYDMNMIRWSEDIGEKLDLPISKGIYASVPGPNLETKAEYRYLSRIGADAVGMSTVPEVITAVHCGIKCFAVSIITDLCYAPHLKPVNIEEIIATANTAEPNMTALFNELVKRLA
jgi:purine-nucleoside phosphorylase